MGQVHIKESTFTSSGPIGGPGGRPSSTVWINSGLIRAWLILANRMSSLTCTRTVWRSTRTILSRRSRVGIRVWKITAYQRRPFKVSQPAWNISERSRRGRLAELPDSRATTTLWWEIYKLEMRLFSFGYNSSKGMWDTLRNVLFSLLFPQ